MITTPLIAELAAIRERPHLAVVMVMPLAALMFVGLFLGELIGLLLGMYFTGINVIFLRNTAPSARTTPTVSGPCLDLIPEKT